MRYFIVGSPPQALPPSPFLHECQMSSSYICESQIKHIKRYNVALSVFRNLIY